MDAAARSVTNAVHVWGERNNVDLKEYIRLKDKVDSLQREADREDGAFEQNKKQLAEYGCQSVKEAEKQLSRLKREEQQLTKQCEQGLAKLLADFPQLHQ